MPKIFLIVIVLTLSLQGICQVAPDSIHIVKQKKKYVYYQGNRTLSFLELKKIVLTEPETKEYIYYASQNRIFSNIFFGLGVITFAYGTLSQLESGDKTKILSGFIAGLVVGGAIASISIPFRIGHKKQILKAVKRYNQNYKDVAKVNFGLTSSGIVLSLRF